jgi:hypothetical protein
MVTDVQNAISREYITFILNRRYIRSLIPFMYIYIALTGANKFVHWKELLKVAKPGDLIEFCRGAYNHWAMMSEHEGKIYNICAESKGDTRTLIKLESLREVCLRGPSTDRQRARVNNKDNFRGLLPMAATRSLNPLPTEESLQLAREMLDTSVKYKFTEKNCEYYCTLWKFGEGFTDQVSLQLKS